MKSLLPSLLLLAMVLGVGYTSYRIGYARGLAEIHLAWEQDKAAARVSYDALAAQIAEQERTHRIKQQEISDALAQGREAYEVALVDQRAVYEQRLLQSARRAEVYLRQAEAGAVAQRNLASHAARLDRALEEGLGLVEELQGTLGLREHQLRLCGQQILNDRQLLEGPMP